MHKVTTTDTTVCVKNRRASNS